MSERRFARTFESLDPLFSFIAGFLASRGVAAEQAHDVQLVAEELFTNLVKHNRDGRAPIAVQLSWQAPVLTLTLRDFGVEPFDVTRAAPPDLDAPLAARRAGGLGLHLVRRIADRLDYDYRDRTSTITVTKRLEP